MDIIRSGKNKNFECKQCGRCCLLYGSCLPAFPKDLELWEKEGRDDILAWVEFPGDLWTNQENHKEVDRCPWLRKFPNKNKYYCRIYDVRPEVCRKYPVDKEQALHDKCPGCSKK